MDTSTEFVDFPVPLLHMKASKKFERSSASLTSDISAAEVSKVKEESRRDDDYSTK